MTIIQQQCAYTTLITRASYLAGVIILAYSLRKQGSKYPLIVFYTPSLSTASVHALELEAKRLNLILQPCDNLIPRADVEIKLIAERFKDTWTKLNVFNLQSYSFNTVCYLDADMAIFNRNMDEIFEIGKVLPEQWIAVSHACICNSDGDSWAPKEWNKGNCAHTHMQHPQALTQAMQPTNGRYSILNSGMFLYHPSTSLWDQMMHCFHTSDKLSAYKFPDQDFLADFFTGRWLGISWRYNALKTMRYRHPNIWRDEEVLCLHYIVDKPWTSRVVNGIAGYKGTDGITHQWWWDLYSEWEAHTKSNDVLSIVRSYIASTDGKEHTDPDMRMLGNGVQDFAKKCLWNKENQAMEKDM